MNMTRSNNELEEELMRIWSLVGELSEQLSSNRALAAQLKAKSENVKGQAAHVGTGFPLRRFNIDITNEEFHSELEGFAAHLVLENQSLQHENKQLNSLLKEYEQTLETVMNKFRGIAHASSQHDLSLHTYYTSLLQTLQTAHSSAQLHDNTSLSLLLTRLSTLLRSALRSLGGEEDFDLAAQLPGLLYLASEQAPSEISSSPKSPEYRTLPKAPARPAPFPGFIPGSSGGYAGTEGQLDWSMEREMEILRLEEENKSLREMLAIAEEAGSNPIEREDSREDKREEEEGFPSYSRKNSLTMEELEADAEQEEEAAKALGLEADSLTPETPPDSASAVSAIAKPVRRQRANSGSGEELLAPGKRHVERFGTGEEIEIKEYSELEIAERETQKRMNAAQAQEESDR